MPITGAPFGFAALHRQPASPNGLISFANCVKRPVGMQTGYCTPTGKRLLLQFSIVYFT
jgi:hypothetical protein